MKFPLGVKFPFRGVVDSNLGAAAKGGGLFPVREVRMEKIHEVDLLRRYIADGFPLKALSKTTGIPENTLIAISKDKTCWFSETDAKRYSYMVILLCQLYVCTPDDTNYYEELVHSLVTHFGIPTSAIANYSGVSESELAQVLHSSPANDQTMRCRERLLHLFLQFARNSDLSFSCTCI